MQSLAQQKHLVGINVSSRRLDVYIVPRDLSFNVPITRSGLRGLQSKLFDYDDVLHAMEVTGGLRAEPDTP